MTDFAGILESSRAAPQKAIFSTFQHAFNKPVVFPPELVKDHVDVSTLSNGRKAKPRLGRRHSPLPV